MNVSRCLGLIAFAALVACTADSSSDVMLPDEGLADASQADRSVPPDEGPDLGGCITDCWLGYKCVTVSGSPEVRRSVGWYMGRECSSIDVLCSGRDVIAECERGCASYAEIPPYRLAGFDFEDAPLADADARRLCEDWRPRTLADECTTDDDCRDTLPHRTEDFEWSLRHLYCESGRCFPTDPPPLGDHGADCGSAPPTHMGARGVYESAGCASGLCAFFGEPTAPDHHGCTSACDYDSDCPLGHRCVRWDSPDGARTVGPGHCLPGLSPDQFGAWYE